MRIVVTGSLAYDYIMNFPGYFKDHILPEKAHILSVSFLVDAMRKMRGGVAGNIAYNLALLGERPLIFGTAGHDFGEYRHWLETQGIETSRIVTIDHEFTSSCFITTDQADNQIVAFYSGAMAYSRQLSLRTLELSPDDLVLISPSDSEGMYQHAIECQELGIPYVFDPGKQTPRLEAAHLRAGLTGARVLVGNDYEFGMMARKLEISEEDLIASTPVTVVTRGELGSTIYTREPEYRKLDIPVAPIHEVNDPTGAGDAYLAGLVYGLVRRLPLEVTGRVAALAAAYAIEQRGCQEHRYTLEAFAARYEEAFGRSDLLA
ncbi:MAG: carbohydrate kinase family protein [Chloroflexaceae bacterium]|nr:carbohydrate kinase family protein [Chloroflexaceae bacterium]